MNPLTPEDLPILEDLFFEAKGQEQKALILRLEEAAKGSTGVEIATAGTEAARIIEEQRQKLACVPTWLLRCLVNIKGDGPDATYTYAPSKGIGIVEHPSRPTNPDWDSVPMMTLDACPDCNGTGEGPVVICETCYGSGAKQ